MFPALPQVCEDTPPFEYVRAFQALLDRVEISILPWLLAPIDRVPVLQQFLEILHGTQELAIVGRRGPPGERGSWCSVRLPATLPWGASLHIDVCTRGDLFCGVTWAAVGLRLNLMRAIRKELAAKGMCTPPEADEPRHSNHIPWAPAYIDGEIRATIFDRQLQILLESLVRALEFVRARLSWHGLHGASARSVAKLNPDFRQLVGGYARPWVKFSKVEWCVDFPDGGAGQWVHLYAGALRGLFGKENVLQKPNYLECQITANRSFVVYVKPTIHGPITRVEYRIKGGVPPTPPWGGIGNDFPDSLETLPSNKPDKRARKTAPVSMCIPEYAPTYIAYGMERRRPEVSMYLSEILAACDSPGVKVSDKWVTAIAGHANLRKKSIPNLIKILEHWASQPVLTSPSGAERSLLEHLDGAGLVFQPGRSRWAPRAYQMWEAVLGTGPPP